MAYGNDARQQLQENLMDACCTQALEESCLACYDAGWPSRMLPKLKEHRAALLRELHKTERALDCLDYLMHQIESKNE